MVGFSIYIYSKKNLYILRTEYINLSLIIIFRRYLKDYIKDKLLSILLSNNL